MGARWYDPRLGRFMGTDPAGFREDDVISFNRYAYGNNNPYGNLDPDGNIPIPVLVFGAYKLASLGYDAYSTYRTLSSADATTTDKALAVGGMAAGAIDPTGVSRHVRSMRQGGGGVANSGRGKNRLGPDTGADGPHSTFKTNPEGRTSNYATYAPNPRNPTGFQETKRVDITGRPHRNPDGTIVPTPHVTEAGRSGVRPARPDELP